MVAPYLAEPSSNVTYPVDNISAATLRVVDHDMALDTRPEALARLSTPPTVELTAELDGATLWLGLAADEILLAALGRTIARTIGDGVVTVDVAGGHGWLLHAVPLNCATTQQASPTEMLRGVHHALAADPHHPAHPPSEIFLNCVASPSDAATPMHELPGVGHALELRVYRVAGLVHLDWWYDADRLDHYTVEELTEQFPLALFEMTSDAEPPF